MSDSARDPEVDLRLLAALRHAPDRDLEPPAALDRTILAAARHATDRAASPPDAALADRRTGRMSIWQRWTLALRAGLDALGRPAGAAALGSVLLAGLIGLLWRDGPPPEAMPTGTQVDTVAADDRRMQPAALSPTRPAAVPPPAAEAVAPPRADEHAAGRAAPARPAAPAVSTAATPQPTAPTPTPAQAQAPVPPPEPAQVPAAATTTATAPAPAAPPSRQSDAALSDETRLERPAQPPAAAPADAMAASVPDGWAVQRAHRARRLPAPDLEAMRRAPAMTMPTPAADMPAIGAPAASAGAMPDPLSWVLAEAEPGQTGLDILRQAQAAAAGRWRQPAMPGRELALSPTPRPEVAGSGIGQAAAPGAGAGAARAWQDRQGRVIGLLWLVDRTLHWQDRAGRHWQALLSEEDAVLLRAGLAAPR